MALRDLLRKGDDGPKLYRRAWSETSDPLVAEARAQTLAIQRLQIWLRLAYSILALAVLAGYWGFAENGGTVPGVIGVLVGIVALAVVLVLRTGIGRGRENVQAMLAELERRKDSVSS